MVTHSFALQDCRRAHLKNPTLGSRGFALDPTAELTAFPRPPGWWVGAYRSLLTTSPRLSPLGFESALPGNVGCLGHGSG